MNMRGRSLFLAATVFLIPGHLPAADLSSGPPREIALRADISGYVFDTATGEPLPYAGVMLKGTRTGTITNVSGHFALVNVPAGQCTLVVSFIGYADKEVPVNAASGGGKSLRIALTPIVFEEEGITVYAEQYQMWKAADDVGRITFSARDLTDLPSMGEVDVFRSLQLLPGISAVGDGSSGLYVRGGTPDQNLVLFDGMTVYHVDHFFGMFSAFNADAIKDIQVYKGGYPARFGGRLSSVVDLTGKNGDVNTSRLAFGGNLLSAYAVAEVPLFGKGSWLLAARRSYTDVVRTSLYNKLFGLTAGESSTTQGPGPQALAPGGPGGSRFGNRQSLQQEAVPDFYFYDVDSKLSCAPTERDAVSFSLYAGQDKLTDVQQLGGLTFGRPGDAAAGTSGSLSRSETTGWGNFGGSVRWARQWGDRIYTTLQFAGSEYKSTHSNNRGFVPGDTAPDTTRREFGSSALGEDNRVRDLTVSTDVEWQATSRQRLGFGVNLSELRTSYVATVNDTIERVNRDQTSRLSSLYVEDKWRPWHSWEFTAGLRGAHYDRTGSVYLEPRAALRYFLTDHITLKGAWGWYHQYVNRITNEDVLEGSRDFWLVADKELEPGFAEHRIAGISYENATYLFEVEGYHKQMDNLLEYTRRFRRGEEAINPFHSGSGVARGVDFLVQRKTGALTGWISYTLGQVRYTFATLNNAYSFPASHDRTHELKTVGVYKSGPWTLSATWVYATGKPYTAPESQYFIDLLDGTSQGYIHVGEKNGTRLPAYHRLDLSGSTSLGYFDLPNWDVGISLLNLYNHANVSYRTYNLDVVPIVVTDVRDLGFTPTVFVKATF